MLAQGSQSSDPQRLDPLNVPTGRASQRYVLVGLRHRLAIAWAVYTGL